MRSRLIRWMTGPQHVLGRFLACVILGILCIVGAIALRWRNATWADRVQLPSSDPFANHNQLGVNVDLQQYDPTELSQVLADIEASGFRWVRQRFPWNELEPERNQFEWAVWDRIVQACSEHELELYITDNKDNISYYYTKFLW